MGRRRRLVPVALVTSIVTSVGLGSCGGDDGPSSGERTAAMYEAVLTELVLADQPPTTEGEPLPIVFVNGADGETVPVDVQALVVKPLKDDIDLRFVDVRDDAILLEEIDEPVKDEGVLITLAAPPETGSTVQFEVDVYRSANEEQQYLVTLAGAGTRWSVRSAEPIG